MAGILQEKEEEERENYELRQEVEIKSNRKMTVRSYNRKYLRVWMD